MPLLRQRSNGRGRWSNRSWWRERNVALRRRRRRSEHIWRELARGGDRPIHGHGGHGLHLRRSQLQRPTLRGGGCCRGCSTCCARGSSWGKVGPTDSSSFHIAITERGGANEVGVSPSVVVTMVERRKGARPATASLPTPITPLVATSWARRAVVAWTRSSQYVIIVLSFVMQPSMCS